jgi:hypothetical protein
MLARAALRTPLVVSFPKAGRTWLRVMLDAIDVDAEYTHFGADVVFGLSADALAPRAWWTARRPALLLVRDPRDTLVSSFHQATKRRNCYDGSLAAFARDPRFGIEKLVRWNLMWAQHAQASEAIAILSYEGLRAEGTALLRAAARHLGGAPCEEAVRAAWEHAQFDAMRARERSGAVEPRYRKRLGARDANEPDSYKVRKGVIGGYRDELGAEDVAFCEAVMTEHAYADRIASALAARGLRAD